MSDETSACALWYMRLGAPGFELCDDEREAAQHAAWMEDDGEAAALGVQFPDGRLIAREDWTAYQEAQRKLREDHERRWAQQPANPPATRTMLDPFEGRQLVTLEPVPSWVGKR